MISLHPVTCCNIYSFSVGSAIGLREYIIQLNQLVKGGGEDVYSKVTKSEQRSAEVSVKLSGFIEKSRG